MHKEREQYWDATDGYSVTPGQDIEFRSRLALVLIEKWGTVAAKIDGEDKAGRSKMELQTPEELVDRCFAIADLFVDMATQRGEIRRALTKDERLAKLEKESRASH